MAGSMHDILEGYPYKIIYQGETGAGFVDVTGLESAQQVTFRTGVIITHKFFDWVMLQSTPHSLRLVRSAENGQEQAGWDLSAAKVKRVTATTFTGSGFPFRVEALELTVESVRVSENN